MLKRSSNNYHPLLLVSLFLSILLLLLHPRQYVAAATTTTTSDVVDAMITSSESDAEYQAKVDEAEATIDELHRQLAKIAMKKRELYKTNRRTALTRGNPLSGISGGLLADALTSRTSSNVGIVFPSSTSGQENKAVVQMLLGYIEATQSAITVLAGSDELAIVPRSVGESADSALMELSDIADTIREAVADESLTTAEEGPLGVLVSGGLTAAIAVVELYISIMNNVNCCKTAITLLNSVTQFLGRLRSLANPSFPSPVTAPKAPAPVPTPVATPTPPKASPTPPTPTRPTTPTKR